MRGLIVAANQDPRADARLLHLRGDQPVGVPRHRPRQGAGARLSLTDIFSAAAGALGGFYVNDFNLFGRTWQVNLQAEAATATAFDDIYRIHVRNADGEMMPLRAVAEVRIELGPQIHHPLQQLPRRDDQRRAARRASPRARRSRRWNASRATTLPRGYGFEWTGTAFQEKAAAGQTGTILALAVLFAYLFLVALYESWTIPVPVLLSVSVGVLGAFGGDRARRGCRSTSMPRSASSC